MNTAIARPGLSRILILGPLLILASLALGSLAVSSDMESVLAAIILSVLVMMSLVLFWVVARSDPEGRTLLVVLLVGLGLKLVALTYRYFYLMADAYAYDWYGREIAAQLAAGQWPEDMRYMGTEFLRLLTGLTYFALGVTFPGISILWTWLGLVGMLFFYKAFCTAFPGGNRRLYMYLILLYPSMLLWTSSLGKDALMVLFLGMAAYGAARIQRRIEFVGLWWVAAGIGGALSIRPHVAAAFAVALGASTLIRPIRAGLLTPVIRIASVAIFFALAVGVARSAAGFVALESLSGEDVVGFVETRREASTEGASAFEQVDPRTPSGALMLFPTIVFRPFPWEAHNAFSLVAALEGVILFALVVYRWRSVSKALLATPRNSYILLTVVYVLLFVFLFSAIANFGILARQRVQLLPFLFMWAAYLPGRPQDGNKV